MIEWLRADLSIRSNEKFIRLGKSLMMSLGCRSDVARMYAIGSALMLWLNVAEHRPSGDLSGIDDDTIEEWAGWRGEPGMYARSFRDLFVTGDQITGWEERQMPLIAMQMAKQQAKVAKKERDKLAIAERRSRDREATSERHPSDKTAHTNTNKDTNRRSKAKDIAVLPVQNGVAAARSSYALVRSRIDGYFADLSTALATKRSQRDAQIDIVFAYWVAIHHKERSLLDTKRMTLIKRRLDENGGDLSELLYALDASLKDKVLTEGGYDMIETILRDRGQVERLAKQMKRYQDGEMHGMARKLHAEMSVEAPRSASGLTLTEGNSDGILHGSEATGRSEVPAMATVRAR